MDKFYLIKTVLLILLFSFLNSFSSKANASNVCSDIQDSLNIVSDHSRFTVAINQSKESVLLTNLEPGKEYEIWASVETFHDVCVLNLSEDGLTDFVKLENEPYIEVQAVRSTAEIFVRSKNCSLNSAFFATLSISKKEENQEDAMRSGMMGIMTDPSFTPEQLIEDIFIGGGCFDVSNVQAIGNSQGIGFFNSGTSSIGLDEGVILASGAIGNSAGPNNTSNITTNFNDLSGDPDLDILATGNVFDAVGIEFDFTPVVNTIQFRYVFASDEYCDYVNTGFNDVFGFFISGPGISGGFTNNGDNIATVPGTTDAVSINTINIQTNPAYYVDNVPIGQLQFDNGCVAADLNNPGAAETEIEYDGFTTILTATANVQACETYHIRMVVGDVNDGIFDSAVFLEANSFNLGGDVSMDVDLPGLGSTGVAYEGCAGDGFIIFERPDDVDLSLPFDVYFNLSPASTATSGADFTALPPFITIPAGQTQFLLPFSVFEDFIIEGSETIILELDNPCTCQDASIEIEINDLPPMEVSTPEWVFCNETSTTLFADVIGGIPGYTYQWSNGGNGPSITVDATVGTQTYDVTVTDECGTQSTSTASVTVQEEAFAFIEGFIEVCEGNPTGILTINFTGPGPWDLTLYIDGVPQAPIIGITENPYFVNASEVGVYTIGGLFVEGCPGVGDGSGIVLPTIFNSFIVPTSVSCPENFDGALDLLINGGAPDYTYEWSNDMFTEDLDNLGPGTYTVTVTDMNGCTHVDSEEVVAPDTMMADIIQLQGVDCLDSLSGSADLTVNGGSPNYTYEWDNGSTDEDPTNLSAGPHTVTVTDSLGCVTDAMVTITQDAIPPVAEAEASGILTCDSLIVNISGANSSGGDSLSYVWLDPNGVEVSQDTLTDVEAPGTYTLIVTNLQNGCSDETTVDIEQDIVQPNPNATGGILTCDVTEVFINANGSSGTGNLDYQWLDSNGGELGTNDSISVTVSGTYTLIITDDSNGCTAETTANVELDENLPEPQADPSGILNCNETMVSIDGSGSTANGAIIYQWLDTNGDSLSEESQIEVMDPGTYTLIITDADNGCSAEITAVVDQNNEEPVPEAMADGVLNCIETMVALNGSGSSSGGGLTYQWLDNGTEIGSTEEITVTAVGTYTLIVTDSINGCTAETTVTVEENMEEPSPAADVSGLLTCDIEMVTIDGSTSSGTGDLTYQWLDSNGDIVSEDPSFEVGNTGTYTLIITDAFNGCTAETAVTVDENIAEPIANAGDGDILDCDAVSVNLNGAGSSEGSTITYEWLNESSVTIGEDLSIDVSEAGTYTLIVTDSVNGCTAEAQVIIEVDENLPDPNPVVEGVINCNESSITLNGSGSTGDGTITYQWLDENGEEISIEDITTVSEPGNYTLVITDTNNSCTAQETVEVLENIMDPEPDILDPVELTCEILNAELNASGSSGMGTISYQWEDNGGVDLGTNSTINVSDPGTYYLTITDAENGCTAETTVIVDGNIEEPSPMADVSGLLTCDVEMVTIDGSTSTGNGDLSYQWLDANGDIVSEDPSFDIGSTGTYTLIITDAFNGCTAETAVTVDENIEDPIANAGDDDILNCDAVSVNLNGNGSTEGNTITYEWLNESDITIGEDLSIDVSEAGTYTLIVTNSENGCTAEAEVTIEADENLPEPDAVVQGVIDCIENNSTLNGSGSTGNGPLTYQWVDENGEEISIEQITTVSDPGIYTLIITDTNNSCTAQETVEVIENIMNPEPDILDPELLTCDVLNVALNAGGSSGMGTVSYQWEDNSGVDLGISSTINVSDPGTYFLTITDAENGCTEETMVVVEENIENPIPDANVDGILTCTILNVILDGSNSTGTGDLSYQWLDENLEEIGIDVSNEINTPGLYTLIITNDLNGCTAETTVNVDQDITDPQALADVDGILNCENNSAQLDGTLSTGINLLDYQWNNAIGDPIGNTAELEVEEAGTYTLIVTDQVNGCTNETEVMVDTNVDTPQPDAIADGILTCENLAVTLDGSGSTSSGNISYQWLDVNNQFLDSMPTLDVETMGTYTLIITDQTSLCSESITVDVGQDIIPPLSNAGPENTLTCDTETVLLDGTSSSTGSDFTYEWINAGGVTVGEDITTEVSEAGEYILVVTNTENGCTASSMVEVVPDENLPIADAGPGSLLTCSVLEATLNGGNSSNGNNISYQWLDPNGDLLTADAEVIVSNPGTYTFVVTDNDNGCSTTASVEVDQNINAPEAIPGNGPTLTCDLTEVQLDASGSLSSLGNLNYQWYDTNGMPIGTDSVVMVDMAGIYGLVVTAENGCIDSSAVEVLLDAAVPIADPGENGTLNCDISVITLGGANTSTGPGITYQWEDVNNVIVGEDQFLDVSLPGTYTLTVFNSNNNCEISAEAIIDENVLYPQVDVGAGGLLTCEETGILLGGSGTSAGSDFQYEWTNSIGQIISTDSVQMVEEPGIYTLTVFNTLNGCETSEEISVNQDIITPVAVTGPGGILTCDVTEISLDGGASTGSNLSYEWFNEAGVLVDELPSVEVSEAGFYTLVVTNTFNGCVDSTQVEVTPDENVPTAIAIEDGILTCAVSEVALDGGNSSSVSGNISYEWLDPNEAFLSNDPNLMVDVPGVYTLIITDTENGCDAIALVEVPQDIQNPDALAGENDTLTCTTTQLLLNGSGTNGINFSFEWLDANNMSIAQTSNVVVENAGIYTLIVTNQTNGCSANDQVEILPDVDLPLAAAGAPNTLTCVVESVILDASSSQQGSEISYEWQDPNSTPISNELQVEVSEPGSYTIIVTNTDNGCSAQDVVIIDQDINDPSAAIDGIGPLELNCDTDAVVLNGENSTPFDELAFDWSTNNGNITTDADFYEIEINEPGVYTLLVTNEINGCTDTHIYNVNQDITPPSAFIDIPSIINCYVPEVIVNAVNTSGNGNFEFSWQAQDGTGIVDGINELDLTVNESGIYILTIENTDNGCDHTEQVEVLADIETPDAVANVDDVLDCVTPSVQLNGTGSSTGSIFNYEWQGDGITGGTNSLQPTVNQTGFYTLIVTNTQNGCIETDEIFVFENNNQPNAVALDLVPPNCPGDEASIEILNVIGGEGPYVYSIDGGATFYDITFFYGLDPGTYDLVIQDAIGCEYDELVSIPQAESVFVQTELDLEIELGDTVQLQATSNVPEWALSSINWTNSESLSCNDCLDPLAFPLQTTTYVLTVMNENGCPATDEITLRVRKNRGVYIPNVFTPFNNDNINDIFHIFSDGKSVKSINTFQVFDRWGELVFEDFDFMPDDPAHGWDGTLRGEPMNPAVFVYWAAVEFIDGEVIIFKGDVTLVR